MFMINEVKMTEKDYAFYPIKHGNLIKHYYNQRDMRWVPAEIDLGMDKEDWNDPKKCNENIKTFIKGVLSFFVPSDGIVVDNIFSNFQQDTSMYKEATAFYAEQNSMEMVHSEQYSLMAQAIISDKDELYKIFNSISEFPAVNKIAAFTKKYMDRSYSLPIRIFAFACVEGVLFTSAFAAIYWVKKKNILRGFCKANEWIARDEGIHTQFASELFCQICKDEELGHTRPTEEEIHEVLDEAVEANALFIKDILPVELIEMSSLELLEYTKCTADALCTSMGYSKKYNAKNPFDWMAIISLPNRTNFFEDKVSEYAKPESGQMTYDLEVDF